MSNNKFKLSKIIFWTWPLIVIAGIWLVRISTQDVANPYGKKLYDIYCLNCHQDQGTGLGLLIPPLAQADYLELNKEKIACIIRNGMAGPITVNGEVYHQPMPANKDLSPEEVYNIMDYIFHSWGNEVDMPARKEIQSSLELCP